MVGWLFDGLTGPVADLRCRVGRIFRGDLDMPELPLSPVVVLPPSVAGALADDTGSDGTSSDELALLPDSPGVSGWDPSSQSRHRI